MEVLPWKSCSIRKADAIDSDFVFAYKEGRISQNMWSRSRVGTIHIRGDYTISGLIRRTFALSNFKETMLDSSPHPVLPILSRSISSLSIQSIKVEGLGQRA